MAQHFLLSAAARTLSLKAIFAGGETKAYRRFCALRWPETNGSPVCPRCGCLEFYDLKARRRFKCAACHHQFSATSGTIFASRKLSFVDLLGAICLFVNASKGMSAVQLTRNLDVQYKTAFVLMHKLREAMARETANARLKGDVEIDGAYFGGHVRPANARKDRIDRRLLKNRSGKRRVVIVLRQRGGRTLTRAFLREADGVSFARERIEPESALSADEVAHWDLLGDRFDLKRVNHSEAYSENGVHTNLAESFAGRPDAHAFTLLDHANEFEPGGVPQGLYDFEDDRVPKRRIACVKFTLHHDAFGELRFVSSRSISRCRAQISAISPFLKKPWLTMYRAR